jgi:hypothetical protein
MGPVGQYPQCKCGSSPYIERSGVVKIEQNLRSSV